MADDSAFFVKTIDAPASLSDADMREFVKTWVENSSPMPIEKMRIGFIRNGGRVTIFAGLEERVFSGFVHAAVSSADYFAPSASLLPLCGLSQGRAIFKSSRSLSFIEFKDGSIESFSAVTLGENIAEDLKKLRAMAGSSGGEKICALAKISLNGRAVVEIAELDESSLLSGDYSSAKISAHQIQKKSLASLDVRDGEIMKKTSRKRRAQEMKMLFVKLVPLAFALLAAVQVFLWFKQSRAFALREEVAVLSPKAKDVESQSERLAELRLFSEKRFNAIDTLALVNFSRADEIRFSRVVQTSPFDVEVAGAAPTIGEVHSFLKALKRVPEIKSVDLKTETSRGEARFNFNIRLK